ncbi:MAG: hypothetical protein J4F36_13175 [Nitrosopumilaceae archaeon]|nr:hypothetical protein [Nitrosopumilaceae archaeon]
MSFSKEEYVCSNCGYDKVNSSGIFKEDKSPYREGPVCFRCDTDTPEIITKEQFETEPCKHDNCGETRIWYFANFRIENGKVPLAHSFES